MLKLGALTRLQRLGLAGTTIKGIDTPLKCSIKWF